MTNQLGTKSNLSMRGETMVLFSLSFPKFNYLLIIISCFCPFQLLSFPGLNFHHTYPSYFYAYFLDSDRLWELERDKIRLKEQLDTQRRDTFSKERAEYWKKTNKSKKLLEKGFKKLKGKIQVCK